MKKITTKGALEVGVDVVLMAAFFIGGVSGIMYASVLTDITMWFYVATGVLLLMSSAELLMKVTKPLDNYDTSEV